MEQLLLVFAALGGLVGGTIFFLQRRKRPVIHAEYTLHGECDGDGQLAALLDRLATLGRHVEAIQLDSQGQPGPRPAPDAPLVGLQVQLRLAADRGPGRVLLRLLRSGDRGVLGLIEIDDDGSNLQRRLAAAIVRELAGMMTGLGYSLLGSSLSPTPAADLGATDVL